MDIYKNRWYIIVKFKKPIIKREAKSLKDLSKDDLLRRCYEVIHRLKSPLPDWFIINMGSGVDMAGSFNDYKAFIGEPLIHKQYSHYNPKGNVI